MWGGSGSCRVRSRRTDPKQGGPRKTTDDYLHSLRGDHAAYIRDHGLREDVIDQPMVPHEPRMRYMLHTIKKGKNLTFIWSYMQKYFYLYIKKNFVLLPVPVCFIFLMPKHTFTLKGTVSRDFRHSFFSPINPTCVTDKRVNSFLHMVAKSQI
jgi:hypothetical protein